VPRARALVFGATALGVLVTDQVTKTMVRSSMEVGQSDPVIEGVLWLTRVHNTGAAFGLFRGQQWMLVIIAVAVLAVIAYVIARVRLESPAARTALALVSAGALGNLIDRVALGGVTDFLDVGWWPVFNSADISLSVGVAILVWWVLFGKEHRNGHADSGDRRAREVPDPGE